MLKTVYFVYLLHCLVHIFVVAQLFGYLSLGPKDIMLIHLNHPLISIWIVIMVVVDLLLKSLSYFWSVILLLQNMILHCLVCFSGAKCHFASWIWSSILTALLPLVSVLLDLLFEKTLDEEAILILLHRLQLLELTCLVHIHLIVFQTLLVECFFGFKLALESITSLLQGWLEVLFISLSDEYGLVMFQIEWCILLELVSQYDLFVATLWI